MSCYGQGHTWTRSSSSANLPAILDYEKCDCGLYTWGECRHYEQRIATLERDLAVANEDLAVAHQIADSFWAAIQPLKLPAINVGNPGAHVVAVIKDLAAAQARIAVLTEVADAAKDFSVNGGAFGRYTRLARSLATLTAPDSAVTERSPLC